MIKEKIIEPIRVLQIIGNVCGGGVEAVIMNYYRHIDRTRIQFDFIIDGDRWSPLDDEIKNLGGMVYHVTSYKKNIFRYMLDVYKIMKKNPYKIIHDNMNTMAFFTLFVAWIARKPIRVLHNHSTNSPQDGIKYYIKNILRPFAPMFANKYMACSLHAARWMFGETIVKRGEVEIINNAIDFYKFVYSEGNRKKIRNELGIPDDVMLIGNVGRLAQQKNQLYMIDLFAEFHGKNNNSMLIIIGEGPLHEELQNRIDNLSLNKDIKLLGLKDNVSEYYSAMDLFLLPSLYEGLPVVVVEAQVNGVPVCVSEAITKEAIFNNNVSRLSLEKSNIVWGDEFIRLKKVGRCNDTSKLEMSGYSIKKEAYKMKNIYYKLISDLAKGEN